jgi:cyanoexosortase B
METKKTFSSPLFSQETFYLVLLVILGVLYGPILIHWYDGWLNKNINIEHEYFSHGMIGLPYAAYLVWGNRKNWLKLEDKNNYWGACILGLGAVLYLSGVSLLVSLSFPIILLGICLWLKGIPGLKMQAVPLLFIFLATPNEVPYLITTYTLPLQQFIAAVAGFILREMGFNVTVDKIHLAVNGQLVEVAPYCAGLKMLFTSFYVSLMLLHWTGNLTNKKKTSLLLLSALIISVTANIIRNTILAFFHGTNNPQMFDWLHEGWGGDVYSAIMLLIILLVLKLMDRFEPNSPNFD